MKGQVDDDSQDDHTDHADQGALQIDHNRCQGVRGEATTVTMILACVTG
jgi:hypothetical protein